MADTDNRADVLDVRNLIERIEELRKQRDEAEAEALAGHAGWGYGHAEREELAELESFVEDLRGNGGDHEWDGSWFPVTLIRDSYFRDFAEEFAEDIGAINSDAAWPVRYIDWEAAAEALQMDYTAFDYAGVTYWGR